MGSEGQREADDEPGQHGEERDPDRERSAFREVGQRLPDLGEMELVRLQRRLRLDEL